MNKVELRTFLEQYSISNGWDKEDSTIVEILRNAKSLKEFGREEHRWYTLFNRVVQIGDIFIQFKNVDWSGDEPPMSNEEVNSIILNSLIQVAPKEVMITDYIAI